MKPMTLGKRSVRHWSRPKLRIEALPTDVKPFDIGIYTFKRCLKSPICPEDDLKAVNGQTFICLYPFRTVDPAGLYCFAIDRTDGNVKTLLKANLQFRKVVTLNYQHEPLMDYVQQTQAKLLVAINYSKDSQQLTL